MKNEQLRKLLASFVDFQIIRDDYIAKKPNEFAIMHTISLTKNSISGRRIISNDEEKITEQTSRLVSAYFQIDCIAMTQARSEEMANKLYDVIVFGKRDELIRNGFGLQSESIQIADRTFLEGSQYIYRFGFDIEINWREISERERILIKDIDYKNKEEN